MINKAHKIRKIDALFTRPPRKLMAQDYKLICDAIFNPSLPDVNEDEGDLRHTPMFLRPAADRKLERG
jgi:hypothetical protein